MRIGVVTTSYPRESGDPAGAFVAGFARWLAEAGAAVEVVAAGPGQPRVDGIEVTRVDGAGLFYAGGAPDALAVGAGLAAARAWGRAAAFQASLTLAVARRIGGWDRVVTHWLAPSALAVEMLRAALPLRPLRPLRHLAVAHSSDVWLLGRSHGGRAAIRGLARRADLVYSARHLVVDGAPGRVVSMGIDPVPAVDRGEARRRWGLDDDTGGAPGGRVGLGRRREREPASRLTAVFLGRLVPVKGLDRLLDELPDELDLIVAGDGPLWSAMTARAAAGRVRFLGEVRGRDKALLFAAADLLVVPSRALSDGRTEGTPTVLLEGLAAGLPIVATRTGGAEDVLRHEETALLVEPHAGALRAALVRVARDPALRRRLADNARRAAPRHGWDEVGPRLAGRLLEGDISAPRRPR